MLEEQHQFAVKGCYAAIVLLYGSEAEADAANAYKSLYGCMVIMQLARKTKL
jgi:hypothetical protein